MQVAAGVILRIKDSFNNLLFNRLHEIDENIDLFAFINNILIFKKCISFYSIIQNTYFC